MSSGWVSLDGYAIGPGGGDDPVAHVATDDDARSMRYNDRLRSTIGSVLGWHTR